MHICGCMHFRLLRWLRKQLTKDRWKVSLSVNTPILSLHWYNSYLDAHICSLMPDFSLVSALVYDGTYPTKLLSMMQFQRHGCGSDMMYAIALFACCILSPALLSAEEALGTCLHTAACRLMRLLKDLSSTDSSYQALLSALLQSLHALQKAVAPLQTGLPLSVWLAAVEGTHPPVPAQFIAIKVQVISTWLYCAKRSTAEGSPASEDSLQVNPGSMQRH